MFWHLFFNLLSHKAVNRLTLKTAKPMASFHISNPTLNKIELDYADIYMFPMFRDNYGYLLVDKLTGKTAVVDPGDGYTVMTVVDSLGFQDLTILSTHYHNDHVGGNLDIKQQRSDVRIVGTKYEPIPGATELVGDGDKFEIGNLVVETIHTPCHTKGHVCYLIQGNRDHSNTGPPILFSGDTLFVGGCGRFFEGNAEHMLLNMDRLATLPSNTLVFCAHEYTQSNYQFLSSIEPERVEKKYNWVKSKRDQNLPTIPSTIGEELESNLFMRCRDSALQERLGCTDPVSTMAKLRDLKNNF